MTDPLVLLLVVPIGERMLRLVFIAADTLSRLALDDRLAIRLDEATLARRGMRVLARELLLLPEVGDGFDVAVDGLHGEPRLSAQNEAAGTHRVHIPHAETQHSSTTHSSAHTEPQPSELNSLQEGYHLLFGDQDFRLDRALSLVSLNRALLLFSLNRALLLLSGS